MAYEVFGRNRFGWLLRICFASFLTVIFSGNAQVPSDVLQQRVAELRQTARDVEIQIEALEELVETTPSKVEQLEDYADQLEALRDELSTINQQNLVKLLLLMSYEVYNTVESTASGGKAVVESFVNIGVRYTLGRLAFENAGAAGQKALGLDASNYLGPRCVTVRRLSAEALAQSSQIAKVHVALNRDLAYYRALVQAEQGADPGERGAILRKNLVVREQIGIAMEALGSLKSTALSQSQQAENDLDWLRDELASVNSLLEGVELQLAEALAAERSEWLAAAQTNLLAQRVEAEPPAPFEFSYPPPTEGDPNYHHNYYTARFQAGVQRVSDILSPVVPTLEALYDRYRADYAEVMTNKASLIAWVQETTTLWEQAEHLGPGQFRSLGETYYDIRDTSALLKELEQKAVLFAACAGQLSNIAPLLVEFNNEKAKARGCDEIATASAYLVSESVPAGQTPRPVLGILTWERLGLTAEMPWGSESFASLPKPLSFSEYFDTLADFQSWQPRIEKALENLDRALQSYREHQTGLQQALAGLLQEERNHQELLDLHTSRLLHSLAAAEELCAAHAFCGSSAVTYYLGIHTTFFNVVRLSEALAAALRDHDQAGSARALWSRYLAFIPEYQALDRQYREAVFDTLRTIQSRDSLISTLRAELDAAVGAAEVVDEAPPAGLALSAAAIEGAYYDALHQAREIRSHQEARSLPECAIADPLPEPVITPKPHVDDPLAKLVPVYGLLLIQERMDQEFKRLMDLNSRQEADMWEVTYAIAGEVNEWKTGHTSVPLAYSLHSVADLIKGSRLYDKRMEWESAFAAPSILDQPMYLAIKPGTTQPLSISVTSHKPFTSTWYRDEWFGDDEPVGSGTSLTLAAPAGLERYYCVVANAFGTNQTARIDVFPAEPPKIALQPQSIEVPTGDPAKLTAQLYLTTSAHVTQTASWFVSVGEDAIAGFLEIPNSGNQDLNLASVTAVRWYYYEAKNPWGTTRSETVKVAPLDAGGPVVLPSQSIQAFVAVPFVQQVDAMNCQGFVLVGELPANWINFDSGRGLLAGTPPTTAPATLSCRLRGFQVQAGKTNYSATQTLSFTISPQSEWPGPRALRYFTPVQSIDPAVAGPNADPDSDGIPNAWEYLLGTSPVQANAQEAKPLFHVRDGRVMVAWERVKDRADLFYTVEGSSDLRGWASIVSLSGNVVSTSANREWVSYETSGTNQVFLRINARIAQ